ncbi:hypothetical protein LA080_004629 [Diaporthe eres]|uniref:Uncharacterized protein n=1 Tax=Diaporthe vaccinii TaxID=105482 RepID=A0ABR4E8M5_9PEZI|nr:hypothetical protein LA080_004629 [Diaporthe eres]
MADQQQDQQHPPEKKSVTRRATNISQKTTKSAWNFLRRGMSPVKTQGDLVQDHVPCYAGMPWNVVRTYLEPKLPPGWNFHESKMNDQWIFVVPRKLTVEEKKELNDLRDMSERTGPASRERRTSVSDEE